MASPEAIHAHYDVSDDFYALWLDASMTYSCALWSNPDDSLEVAQSAKLDYFLTRLAIDALGPEGRVLDVGCGWGSLLASISAIPGGPRAVGLTLSSTQATRASELTAASGRVKVLQESWADHQPELPYDATVSIGAFEHFVGPGATDAERLATYAAFFESMHSYTKPGGRLGLQTIALGDEVVDPASPVGQFFTTEIFPESSLPRLSHIVRASEPWFVIDALRVDRLDYARTCRVWRESLLARRAEAEALVGREVTKRYLLYLLLAEMQFASGASTLYRITFARRQKLR